MDQDHARKFVITTGSSSCSVMKTTSAASQGAEAFNKDASVIDKAKAVKRFVGPESVSV